MSACLRRDTQGVTPAKAEIHNHLTWRLAEMGLMTDLCLPEIQGLWVPALAGTAPVSTQPFFES